MGRVKMRNAEEPSGGKAAVDFLHFQMLEAQARRLERSILALVGVVALAPPFVFSLIELRHLRGELEDHARHCARIVEQHATARQMDVADLRRALEEERSGFRLAFIRVLEPGGHEMLRVGEPVETLLPALTRRHLAAPAAGFESLEVGADDRPLLADIRRVFAIHAVVGLVLGLGIYRVPIRALGKAISELKEAHAQLIHSDRLGALGEVYAGLAHEVNNPLGIILARVKLLRATAREKGLEPEVVQDLEMIERHGSRIGEILRGLLAFARKEEFQKVPSDLNQLVRDVVALVEKPFAKQGIQIDASLAPDLPVLEASPDQLQQVFLNLLSNARDAMPSGGTILLRTFAQGSTLVAEVQDSGTGLAQAARERLFEPFFTTKQVGRGTGLGLSVSYGIVKAHGGELEAENAPGRGALFRLSLPSKGASR